MIPSLIHIGEVIVGVIIAFVLMFLTRGWFILVLMLAGCGIGRYSAETQASYKVTDANGVVHEFKYESSKDQRLLIELIRKEDVITGLKVNVEASTSEAALAAMSKAYAAMADLLEKIMPLIAKGAMAGS